MLKRTKKGIKYIMIFLAVLVVGFLPYHSTAHAEGYTAHDGDGWSMSSDGVMTIENNRGWWNAMKNGFTVRVKKLVIGKDLTEFRIYSLPDDVPSPDFFDKSDIAGYDKYGNPYYDYLRVTDIHPYQIEVEVGNPAFQVVNGLLINNLTGELVLSETRLINVVIPEGIKAITRDAFSERDLISVQFPRTLESIGESAFAKCENLTNIVLPDTLVELTHGAFLGCKKLCEVTLSQNMRDIADSVFGYTALQHIEIPASVTEIGSNAFMGCEQLEEVDFPDGLRRINDGAFSSCYKLYNVVLPDWLEYIGRNAFHSCERLKNIVIPDSVKLVGNSPFSGCRLALLRIPAQLDIVVYDFDGYKFTENKRTRKNRGLEVSSVETVILSGSEYDFGYPAIENAKNVYFLGTPPADVGQILDEESVEHIYCSDKYEFAWTRSKVASWVRQKLTILPAAEIAALTEEAINATPEPTYSPRPRLTSEPTRTPVPVLTPFPTKTPATTIEPAAEVKTPFDPIILAFAGMLALVVAGIVVLAVKSKKGRKRAHKKN